MVNRNLLRIAEKHGKSELPKIEVPHFEGFTYIPKLGYYISDTIEDQFYYSPEKAMKDSNKENSFLLNLRDFWEYYNYIKKYKPEIHQTYHTRKSAYGQNCGEWLDSYVDTREENVVHNRIRKSTHSLDSSLMEGEGLFYPEDVNKKTGFPKKVSKEGNWIYALGYVSSFPPLTIIYNEYPLLGLVPVGTPLFVRECKLPDYMEETNAKS
ncbi:MAG: hypothetical protein CMH62_00875 [Nanoarchaeota archaeon]|nr:hypothetical protein [Nanoarchaeota archaeon]